MLTTLEKFGLICIAIVGFQIAKLFWRILYKLVVGPQLGRLNVHKLKEMGKWSLITGATDGLGKAYAEFLAAQGINVILVSRTLDKLNRVAGEIEKKYNVETKVIEADFTTDVYEHIEKQCTGLEIGILINNVGMTYAHPEYFLAIPKAQETYSKLINCNILSVTNMCKIVMPGMVERRRGIVVNVSSTTAIVPSPLLTVYGATKAYIDKFSVELATEYSKAGITVQSLLPGFIATKMTKIRNSTWMAPTPEKFVAHAIRTIGVEQRTTGYYAHSLLVSVVNCIDAISPKMARWIILRTMENIRSRALQKYLT